MIIVMYTGWQRLFLGGIFILFLWSFFLRFYQFGQTPKGLYWDEAAILLDAKSVAQTGKDMHGRPWYQVIYPSYGDYKLPVYIWLSSVSVKVLGATEAAVRFPSAIAGIITIVVAGFLVRELLLSESKVKHTANLAGLMTASMVALSPWSILFSRTGFEAHLAQAILACSLFVATRSKKKKWLIFLSPILGLLATYTYFSVRYVWLSMFVVLSVLFLIEFQKFRTHFKDQVISVLLYFLLPLSIFCVGMWPMFHSPLYEASNTFRLSTDSVLQNTPDVLQSNVYREIAGNTRLDRVIFFRWWLTGKKLFANYSDNTSLNFLFVSGDPNLRHGTGEHGIFLTVLLPIFFVGWYVLFRRYKRMFILCLCWWLFSLLPASVPNTTPHALRSLNALVPLSGVIGLGLTYLLLKYKKIAMIGMFILFTLNLFQFTHFYFNEYPNLSTSYWQGGFKNLAQTTFAARTANEPIYVTNFDDRFYLWLLLYGPYSSTQVQSFPHTNFQIRDFDNIYTEHIPIEKSKTALIVGSHDQVEAFLNEQKFKALMTKTISPPNQTEFEVVQAEMVETHAK